MSFYFVAFFFPLVRFHTAIFQQKLSELSLRSMVRNLVMEEGEGVIFQEKQIHYNIYKKGLLFFSSPL